MLAYNLMSLLRQVLLKGRAVTHFSMAGQPWLQTLHYKLFAKAYSLTAERRTPILNFVVAMQQCAWIQGPWGCGKKG